MIQSGLYEQLINAPSITALLTSGQAANSVHFVRAPKDPPTPFIVLHLPNVPPAEATFDGSSELIEGFVQFDCYAADDTSGLGGGALNARQLNRAVRDLFKNFSGTLPDGTTISFTDVLADFDDNYELGGENFLFRSVLRLKAFYTEGS